MAKIKQPTNTQWADLVAKVKAKQATLVSGTNIKTINNTSVLGSGDIAVVPTTRTVNSKALSSNITLTASDVGALSTSGGTVAGNLTLKNNTNYGCSINFGDGDHVHISEPTDNKMEIKASNLNFVVSGDFTLNGSPIVGSGSGGGGVTIEKIGWTRTATGQFTLAKSAANYDYVDVTLSESPYNGMTLRFWSNKKKAYSWAEATHFDGNVLSNLSVRLIVIQASLYGTELSFETTHGVSLSGTVSSMAVSGLKASDTTWPTSNLGASTDSLSVVGVAFS